MTSIAEFRSRARHVVGPVIGICAVGYFAYHGINGDRGLIALWQVSKQVEEARVELAEVRGQRQQLASRVRLLHPNSLDLDMLEERARIVLNYGRADELVILTEAK